MRASAEKKDAAKLKKSSMPDISPKPQRAPDMADAPASPAAEVPALIQAEPPAPAGSGMVKEEYAPSRAMGGLAAPRSAPPPGMAANTESRQKSVETTTNLPAAPQPKSADANKQARTGGGVEFKYGGQFRARFESSTEDVPLAPSRTDVAESSIPVQKSYEGKQSEVAESKDSQIGSRAKEDGSPRLRIEKLEIRGDLAESGIRKVIEQNLAQLSQFVQRGSKAALNLQWTIRKDGSVRDIHITLTEGSRKIKDYLGGRMEKWKFPAPADGHDVQVAATVSITN